MSVRFILKQQEKVCKSSNKCSYNLEFTRTHQCLSLFLFAFLILYLFKIKLIHTILGVALLLFFNWIFWLADTHNICKHINLFRKYYGYPLIKILQLNRHQKQHQHQQQKNWFPFIQKWFIYFRLELFLKR